MGQVLSWESVSCGHVPKLEDFPWVIKEVREVIARDISIIGALVCGSVTRGDHNLRSDIDLFVLYDHTRQHEAFRIMQASSFLAASRCVPLTCIPCDDLIAQTRMHHVGGSFLRHLERSIEAGGLLKGDPLGSLARSVSEKDELESYLRMKMYNLQEAWGLMQTFSEERLISYLKKLLEAPIHVARKVLAHQGLLSGDSKSYIRAQYREVMDWILIEQLEELIKMDARYTEELVAQLDIPDEERYRQMLDSILMRSEKFLSFIRANLAFIAATTR